VIAKLNSLTNKVLTHQGFRRYFTNTSWLFAEQILRLVAGLFVGIWVARYLGPEQFGIFSYALAFASLFSGMAKLGLDGILVRELVNHPEQRDAYLGTAFWLRMIGSSLLMGITAIAVQFTNNDAVTKLYILIISAGLMLQGFEVIASYFQAIVQAKYVSICKLIQLVMSSLVKIYLVIAQAELLYFVSVSVFDAFALAIAYVIAYRRCHGHSYYRFFDENVARTFLKESWPLIFCSLAVMIYMRIDQVMVKEMLGERDAGYYAAAVRLSEVWLFVTVVITKSLYPAIVNAKRIDEILYYDRLKRLYRLLAAIAIIISTIVTLYSDDLIYYTYGTQFLSSELILKIYVWSTLFVFFNNAAWSWHISEGLQHIAAFRLSVGAILNICLNAFLIRLYGLQGAAFATVISYAFVGYFGNLMSKKTLVNFRVQTSAIIGLFDIKALYR
jgi:O-antigen/teichoic acid export membrane protein